MRLLTWRLVLGRRSGAAISAGLARRAITVVLIAVLLAMGTTNKTAYQATQASAETSRRMSTA